MGYLVGCDSPNQDGVEGTECEEVWIFTDTSAILLIIYLLVGNTFVLPHQGDIFFCWFATGYISLRNSWALRLWSACFKKSRSFIVSSFSSLFLFQGGAFVARPLPVYSPKPSRQAVPGTQTT